jgi:hypothetical protein
MNRYLVYSFALAVLIIPVRSARADDGLDCEYYPLKVGTSWECKAMGQAAAVKVAKHEKFAGVMCALVETSIGGNVVASEHISVGKDGLYRHSFGGQKVDPPVKFIQLPMKDGDTWKSDTKLNGQDLKSEFKLGFEDVTVAAGKFEKAAVVTANSEIMGQKLVAKVWYGKGVGMVRTELEIAGNKVEIELEKFIPAK